MRCVMFRQFLLLFAVAWLSAPGSSMAMDIFEAYEKALAHDSKYREAVSKQFSKQEGKAQGIAGLLPRAEFVGSLDRIRQKKTIDAQAASSTVEFSRHDYDVRLSQPLFDAEKMALFRKGQRQAAQSEIELELARQDLRLRVAQAFFDYLYAEDSLKAYEAQKKATYEFLDQARKSFKIGTVTVSDVYDAETRYEMVSAKVLQAEVDLELKRKALSVLTGDSAGRIYPLRELVNFQPPVPAELPHWLEQARSSNLDVQIQLLEVELASAELDLSKAGHLPKLELTARHNSDRQSATLSSYKDEGPGQNTRDSYIGIQATLSLFEGGYVASKVRAAEYSRIASSDKLETVRRESVEKARESFFNTTVGARKMNVLRSAVSSSQDSLRASKLGYGVGVRSAVDVLNAQELLSQALREQSKAIYDALLFALKLKASVGALSDEDLMKIRAYTEYLG